MTTSKRKGGAWTLWWQRSVSLLWCWLIWLNGCWDERWWACTFPYAIETIKVDRAGNSTAKLDAGMGMSLRDYFAAAALTGIWANVELLKQLRTGEEAKTISSMVFEQADAIIAERSK